MRGGLVVVAVVLGRSSAALQGVAGSEGVSWHSATHAQLSYSRLNCSIHLFNSMPSCLHPACADLSLLKHDKPLAASGAAAASAHLKHIPAYLRDPTLQGKSFVGNSGEAGGMP